MKNNNKKTFFSPAYFCESCGMSSRNHTRSWMNECVEIFLGNLPIPTLPKAWDAFLNRALERLFIFLGIFTLESAFMKDDTSIRTYCFIEEGRKRGITFQVFRGPFGFINYFRMNVQGREYTFEGLPVADFANGHAFCEMDDKAKVKKRFIRGNFPALPGRSFYFFQKKAAYAYGEEIRFPLVVKPRNGSYSRHTTTHIANKEQLQLAIESALEYSPTFVVERFLADSFVFRATVIDFDYVACVRRTTANVIGDGAHTIQELIDTKNADPQRGNPDEEEYTLFKISDDAVTKKVLEEQGYTKQVIPPQGVRVFLQRDPFIRLGADSDEVTDQVHPENMKLFKDIARYFDVRVVGLDFLCSDITKSWKEQPCAVLELNSLPCIEVHHFPSSGKPQNVAGKIVDLVYKYYVK